MKDFPYVTTAEAVEKEVSKVLSASEGWKDAAATFYITDSTTFANKITLKAFPWNNKMEICLWADDGSTSLMHVNNIPLQDDVEKYKQIALERINDFANGVIHCSDCGIAFPVTEIKGKAFYAGIYCQHCWDNKWKAIEAAENYD